MIAHMLLDKAAAYHVTALQGRKCSPHTLRLYSAVHRSFVAYLERVGEPPTIAALSAERVRGYLAELGQRCGASTVNAHMAILCALVRVLADDLGLFPDGNPLAKLKRARQPKTIPATLSRQQFDVLVALALQSRHPLRNAAILKLLVESGLRNNELGTLRLADVQLATAALAGRALVRAGKGAKPRHVGFGAEASSSIAAYLKLERAGGEASPWLFTSPSGGRILPDALRKLVRSLREQAGLSEDIHPHSLRHTFATWRAKAGMNAMVLQAQLGHATLEQSSRYVTLAAQDVQESYLSMLDGPAPRPRQIGQACGSCGCHTAAGRVS